VKRFSAYVQAFGRRSIPLHWNERYQKKNNERQGNDLTHTRRIMNKIVRAKLKHSLRGFKDEWDNFEVDVPKKLLSNCT